MSTPENQSGDLRDEGRIVPRDEVEGEYTEVDGELPRERTVHGQYTETDGVGPETVTEGSYTDSEEPTDTPQGEYTDGDYREP